MKVNATLIAALLFCLANTGCKEQQDPATQEPAAPEADLIVDDYPEARKEVEETMAEIVQSVKDGDIDKLIAFHAYGPKFTEFKNGEPRNGAQANETFERNTFGGVTEVVKMGMDNMKVAVYGDVANVTFHSDFHLMFGDDLAVVNDQITLLFVKNKDGEWKIVHEHHSPLQKEEA